MQACSRQQDDHHYAAHHAGLTFAGVEFDMVNHQVTDRVIDGGRKPIADQGDDIRTGGDPIVDGQAQNGMPGDGVSATR